MGDRGALATAAGAGGRARAAAEAEVKEELEERLENEPKRGAAGSTREYELQARRARRRAHTASLDLSLELVGFWFRDLVAVASGREAQVLNVDRLPELREDARGREAARLIDCVELCEDTRRRLERNVLEDLALEALFNPLRRLAQLAASSSWARRSAWPKRSGSTSKARRRRGIRHDASASRVPR